MFSSDFKILFISLLMTSQIAHSTSHEAKIAGGSPPNKPEEYTQFYAIISYKIEKFFGEGHICGGCILAKDFVITAAHCVSSENGQANEASSYKVITGCTRRLKATVNTKEHDVTEIQIHPLYTGDLENDIAGLRVKEITMEPLIRKAVSLPTTATKENTTVIAIGFGRLWEGGPLPEEIHAAEMKVFAAKECSKLIPGFVSTTMICAGNRDDRQVAPCQGDSGGPVLHKTTVVGIISFGYGCKGPTAFGDMYHYVTWFKKNLATQFNPKFMIISIVAVSQLYFC